MALIKCPECGRGNSDTVTECPGCTYALRPASATKVASPARDPWKTWILVGLVAVVFMAFGRIAVNIAGLHSSSNRSSFSEAQREAAQGFWDTVVDQYVKLGLIARYQSEDETFVMYVRGNQWRHLSYKDKQTFLGNLSTSNEILGRPARVEIRDANSNRTYAVRRPPVKEEVYE